MCNDCVPVELPVEFWQFINVLCADFAAAIDGMPPTAQPRRQAHDFLMHCVQHMRECTPDPADYIYSYLERIELRCGIGEREGATRVPLPNYVRTAGSNEN